MRALSHSFIFFAILLYLIFNLNFAKSQTNFKLDSLLNVVAGIKEDTSKVKLLLQISREYSKSDPGKAMDYSNEASNLAVKLKYSTGVIDAMIEKSGIYSNTGKQDSALIFSQNAIDLSDDVKDERRKAAGYYAHASNLIRSGGPSAAGEYYFKAHKLFKKIGDSTGYMNSLNGLGIVFYKQAEYDSAIYYYLEFLRLCNKFNNEEGLGKGYVNIGAAYYELRDLDNARYYFYESIQVNEKYNNDRLLSIAYINLGSIAFNENNLEDALKYYQQGQDLNKKINNNFGLAQALNNIGNVHEKRKDYNLALRYYADAKDLFIKINNVDGFIAAYKNIGLIYERRKNYNAALKVYDSCLTLARNAKLMIRVNEILYNIHKTYELNGDFKNAYRIQSEQIALNDSLFNLAKDTKIKQLQTKYEKEKDQARILALENENLTKNLDLRRRTIQRNGYLYGGSGLILIILFIFVFHRQKAKKDKIIAEQKIRQLEEEKKLLAARAIVEGQEEERKRIAKELHDGLGVLLSTATMQFSAIKDKSPENKSLIERASKLLEQATGDVRKISHNLMPGLLTKLGFFEAVGDLFDKINEAGKVKAVLNIEGEVIRLPENLEIMLYRVVQEMANNTLKHADSKNISLILNVFPDHLNIQFSDDGKGFDVEEKLKLKTIGLTSILSRVKFLNGEITVESKQGKGSTLFIQIPVSRK